MDKSTSRVTLYCDSDQIALIARVCQAAVEDDLPVILEEERPRLDHIATSLQQGLLTLIEEE